MPSDYTILGLNFLRRYQTIFDMEGQSIGLIGPTRFTANYKPQEDAHQKIQDKKWSK
jgi:hypothetical protein